MWNANANDHETGNANDKGNSPSLPTRGEVLHELQYIQYCDQEEQRVNSLAALRRRLAAVQLHLFVGEEGNDGYQRRIRKLVSSAHRHMAKGMLMAALNEVPVDSVDKNVGDFMGLENVEKGEDTHGLAGAGKHYVSVEHSGPLQKSIY